MHGRNSIDFKVCKGCNQHVALDQFYTTHEAQSAVCNNCLCRYGLQNDVLHKFLIWSRTCKNFKDINSVTTAMFSPYNAAEIEGTIILALRNKENRATLIAKLLEFTGDTGDQLLLAECMEELNLVQDNL